MSHLVLNGVLHVLLRQNTVVQKHPVGVYRLLDPVRGLPARAGERGEEAEVEAGGLGQLHLALSEQICPSDQLINGPERRHSLSNQGGRRIRHSQEGV